MSPDYRIPVWTKSLGGETHPCSDEECERKAMARVGELPYCKQHFGEQVTAALMVSKVLGAVRAELP